jgi:hypothetical protein
MGFLQRIKTVALLSKSIHAIALRWRQSISVTEEERRKRQNPPPPFNRKALG